MDARERWQILQAHLTTARALAEAGDVAAALQEVERALQLDPEFLAAHSLREHLTDGDAVASSGAVSGEPARLKPFERADPASPGLTAIEAKVLARRAERKIAAAADAVVRRKFSVAAAELDEARELGADPGQLLRVERALAEARRKRTRHFVTGRRVVAAAVVIAGVLGARYVGEQWDSATMDSVTGAPAAAPDGTAPNPTGTEGTGGVARPTTKEEIITLKPGEPSPGAPRSTDRPETMPSPTPPSISPQEVAPERRPVASPIAVGPPAGAPVGPVAPVELPARPPTARPESTSLARDASLPTAQRDALLPTAQRDVSPPPTAQRDVSLPTAQLVTPPPAEDETNGVREALQRYRAAYEQLNARSARAVWPAVDERALARAFDGLASQELRFDACDVTVRGNAADATCRGTATYTPKFGSGAPQVEPRMWLFTLRKNAGQWAIETARVER